MWIFTLLVGMAIGYVLAQAVRELPLKECVACGERVRVLSGEGMCEDCHYDWMSATFLRDDTYEER